MKSDVKKFLSDIRKNPAHATPTPNAKRHMARIGGTGGENGTGESKRRSPDHYRRLAKLGVAARLKKWAKLKGGQNALNSLTQ